VLAEGPMGGVLLAADVTHPGGRPGAPSDASDRRVAVKLLRKERITAEIEARFAREARLAAGLSGEHVPRVLASGYAEGGEAFLVMELLEGRDLRAELGVRATLPPRDAVDVVLEACAGVAEAHAAGLVHGALKPANLFLTGRGAVVLDFGL